MPLTPEDVRNKLFTTTKRMRHGYDEDEVDSFLDEVEAELARLLKENADLRAKVSSHTGLASAPAAAAVVAPAAAAPAAAPAMAASASGATAVSADEASSSALRVLAAAQRTADETVAEAKRSADKLMGDAHTRREAADKELAERHKSVMGTLEADRDKLERQVENLRTFEREYRARLKVYLEGQLRDLEGRGGEVVGASRPAPVTGAPAPAGNALGATPAGSAPAPVAVPGVVPPPHASGGGGQPAESSVDENVPSGPPREASGGAFVVDEGPEIPPTPLPPHG